MGEKGWNTLEKKTNLYVLSDCPTSLACNKRLLYVKSIRFGQCEKIKIIVLLYSVNYCGPRRNWYLYLVVVCLYFCSRLVRITGIIVTCFFTFLFFSFFCTTFTHDSLELSQRKHTGGEQKHADDSGDRVGKEVREVGERACFTKSDRAKWTSLNETGQFFRILQNLTRVKRRSILIVPVRRSLKQKFEVRQSAYDFFRRSFFN